MSDKPPRGEMVSGTSGRPTFAATDRWLARSVARPLQAFVRTETAGGLVLLAATVAALAWANSPWEGAYEALWETEVLLELGPVHFEESLRAFVNDALMAVFFFVVGLEVKRELVAGELRDPRAAALPVIAALGGMVVPALLYTAFNAGGEGSAGWGIPMATDIAFAVGVVSVLGRRVPSPLKVFLLSLAIVDDIGAIAVIALFYTSDVSVPWLGIALGGLVLVTVLRRLNVWYIPVYLAVGTVVWFATHESGVHATIAGVALGLIAPARPLHPEGTASELMEALGPNPGPKEAKATGFIVKETVSVAERLEDSLHPWSSFFIVPVFALANAGLVLSSEAFADALRSPVAAGIVVGLVVGKLVGISASSWLAVKLRVARLPAGVRFADLMGVAALAGIGFTVSLFITGLAFEDPSLTEAAKLAILTASAVAAVGGSLVVSLVARRRHLRLPDEPLDEVDARRPAPG